MSYPEYVFDWRNEAGRDGWVLHDGLWRHLLTEDTREDARYVYLGSGVWVETWPHAPHRPIPRDRELAFDV
jgi:hypothetical protein